MYVIGAELLNFLTILQSLKDKELSVYVLKVSVVILCCPSFVCLGFKTLSECCYFRDQAGHDFGFDSSN